MTVTLGQLVRFIELFTARLAAEKEYLTTLDSAIGDADHGINMDRGFQAVVAKLPEIGSGSVAGLFKGVGMTLISTVGGASGPLYGTFFLRAGTALPETTETTSDQLVGAMRAGLEGVIQRGKATLDDKTMVDAMSPAVEALESSPDGTLAAALTLAASAAAAGRDRVTPLVARKGRASYLGDRSAGHQDPGATSTTFLFEALRDALQPGY